MKKDLEAKAIHAAAVFRKHGVSQGEVADMLGASQPQISRLLGGKLRRRSRLFDEICLLAVRLDGGVSREMVIANDHLMAALTETWDGSPDHAKVLASIIRSLAALRG